MDSFFKQEYQKEMAEEAAIDMRYNDKDTYDYVEYAGTTKYRYLTLYNLYIQGKETLSPWEYAKQTKAEFIILYFADIRQQYEDKVNDARKQIIKRSNSF